MATRPFSLPRWAETAGGTPSSNIADGRFSAEHQLGVRAVQALAGNDHRSAQRPHAEYGTRGAGEREDVTGQHVVTPHGTDYLDPHSNGEAHTSDQSQLLSGHS